MGGRKRKDLWGKGRGMVVEDGFFAGRGGVRLREHLSLQKRLFSFVSSSVHSLSEEQWRRPVQARPSVASHSVATSGFSSFSPWNFRP